MGSDINWWNQYGVVREPTWNPSQDDMSSDHQDGDLALKSLSITVKEDSIILTWFNNLSKLTKNSSNSLLNWLGDLYMTATCLFHKECIVQCRVYQLVVELNFLNNTNTYHLF